MSDESNSKFQRNVNEIGSKLRTFGTTENVAQLPVVGAIALPHSPFQDFVEETQMRLGLSDSDIGEMLDIILDF
jgi:hypothetical protein